MERPRCEHCGQVVSVQENARAKYAPSWSAWCGCANVSPTDAHFRDAGYGESEAEAIEAWRAKG